MQLEKADNIIFKLNEYEEFYTFKNLQCWIKSENNYNIYIFSIQLENEIELVKCKDDLRDYLAIYFQSQILKKEVERWNIYQVFFIQKSVSKNVKQQIQQDKFSTRKIILDEQDKLLIDSQIMEKIYAEIFQFEIVKNEIFNKSINDFLSLEQKALFAIFKKTEDINQIISQIDNE